MNDNHIYKFIHSNLKYNNKWNHSLKTMFDKIKNKNKNSYHKHGYNIRESSDNSQDYYGHRQSPVTRLQQQYLTPSDRVTSHILDDGLLIIILL